MQGQGNNQGQNNQQNAIGQEVDDHNLQWNPVVQNGLDQDQDQELQFEEENQNDDEVNPNAQWDMLVAQNVQNIAWDLWPNQQVQQPNNNQNGGNQEIDLNNPANPNMQEVIINPVEAPGASNGGFLELNDLNQNATVEVIQIVGQNPRLDLNAPVVNLEQHQPPDDLGIPHLDLPIELVIDDEEIPLDMLMDEADFEQENAEEEGEEEEEEEPEEEDEEMDDQILENDENNLLNVGAVVIRDEHTTDPVLLQRINHSNQGSYWLDVTNRIPRKTVKVAAQWAPFFASLLLSPGNHKWAKMFIDSEAWAFFSRSLKTSLIKIPNNSPTQSPLCIEAGKKLDLGAVL